jgi:hypothetical protein
MKTRFQNSPFKCNLQRYTTDGTGTGTVTFHVQSDKRKPYEPKTNRFDFDPTSPMVELIYTDNTAGAFVAHGSGWGRAMPVDVFLCRRARVDIQVVDADTGEAVNALGFGYSVSETREKKIRGRSKLTEVECYRGTTKGCPQDAENHLCGASDAGNNGASNGASHGASNDASHDASNDDSNPEEGDEAAAVAEAEAEAPDDDDDGSRPLDVFHEMYANSQGGEYAVRVWCDEDTMSEWRG